MGQARLRGTREDRIRQAQDRKLEALLITDILSKLCEETGRSMADVTSEDINFIKERLRACQTNTQ